jgi:hypothetical protein
VLNRADLNSPLNQFSSSGLDVAHDQLQARREPVAMVTEHAEPGGVSWTFRKDSPIRLSTSTLKPSCSL